VDSISLGRDFRTELQRTLASCDVMLVLIDKDWAAAKDERGRIRLENTGDFVRMEVEAGLKRDIVVTPVLLKGARMPAVEELPAEISSLAYRNAFEISYSRWESDVREMIRRLHLGGSEEDNQVDTKLPKPLEKPPPAEVPVPKVPQQTGATRRRLLIGAGASAIAGALSGGAYIFLNWKEKERDRGQASFRALTDVKALKDVRKQFLDEVQDPNKRRLLAASTAAEVGGQGSEAEQYYIESVFNRAAARGMSLEKTLTDSRYYSPTTLNRLGGAVSSTQQARIDGIIDSVMAGSNASDFATGNESGPVHSGGAPVTRDLGPGKSRFVRELADQTWLRGIQTQAFGEPR
jgi:hypothetical protein